MNITTTTTEQQTYFKAYDSIWSRTDLSPIEKAVYCKLHSFFENGRDIYPSVDYLVKALGSSAMTIKRATAKLESLGLISKQRRFNSTSLYSIVTSDQNGLTPQTKMVSPSDQNGLLIDKIIYKEEKIIFKDKDVIESHPILDGVNTVREEENKDIVIEKAPVTERVPQQPPEPIQEHGEGIPTGRALELNREPHRAPESDSFDDYDPDNGVCNVLQDDESELLDWDEEVPF